MLFCNTTLYQSIAFTIILQTYVNESDMIHYQFEKLKYAIMLADDWMNPFRWPNCYGFKRIPTKHYMSWEFWKVSKFLTSPECCFAWASFHHSEADWYLLAKLNLLCNWEEINSCPLSSVKMLWVCSKCLWCSCANFTLVRSTCAIVHLRQMFLLPYQNWHGIIRRVSELFLHWSEERFLGRWVDISSMTMFSSRRWYRTAIDLLK